MDDYAAQMPLDMDPLVELNQLLAILTTSLDNARMKLWPQGVPFTKTPRPGTWINGELATLTLIIKRICGCESYNGAPIHQRKSFNRP